MSWRFNDYKSRFVASTSSGSQSMNNVPPPPSVVAPSLSKPALAGGQSLKDKEKQKEEEYNNLMYYGAKTEKEARRKRIYDDDYLEKEDSDDERDSRRREDSKKAKPDEDEEEDELDAFMNTVNQQASKDKADSEQKERDRVAGNDKLDKKKGLGRADIDEEDMQESLFRYLEENPNKAGDDDEEYEYDEDGNVIWSWKKVIDPLPSIDHKEVNYPEFHKNFYKEHDEIASLTHIEVVRLRSSLGLRVGGWLAPKPVCSFAHFGFEKPLMESIIRHGYEQPTPIQAQAIPAALSGRDVLGIAKTGSGKTAAYLWPAIVHIMDQPDLAAGDGPIALVVVPTRELAIQVYQEAKRFCKPFNINVICAYGGGSKYEQSQEMLNEGAELVICTPGRIIDLVKCEATNFLRTTFLVFDEADRMFDMGFEAQVKSISDHIRPDRQCLMFSATFKSKVERLARDALRDPVRIVQGEIGEANSDVRQHIVMLDSSPHAKFDWLANRIVHFSTLGKVLVFATKKIGAEELAKKLRTRDVKLVLLHGDMLQAERNEQLQKFRKDVPVMVATDVAARGLDITELATVVNYDLARDIDTHVHRIGRTGRAGQKGDAYTLVTDKDMEMAGHLVRNLESVNQEVPADLMNLAMKSSWFRSQRDGHGGGGARGIARTGLGYKGKTAGKHDALDPLKEQRSSASSSNNKSLRDTMRAASSAGPAQAASGTRLSAMKNAFKASFSATFRAPEMSSSNLQSQVVSDPRPEWKRKIDEINERIASGNIQQQPAAPAPPPEPKQQDFSFGGAGKKSRWQ